MVERRLFEAVGGFNESLLRCQDRDLSIKLAETSPVSALAAPLVKKRVHPEQRGTQQLDVLRYMDQIYRDLLQRTTSGRLRRLCRLWRARVSLDVVHGCRGAGRYAEARRALWVSFRHAGWHAGWWAALIKTLLRPVVPGPLVALYARAWGRHDRVTASPDGRYLSA
jgi:hypothetical protein